MNIFALDCGKKTGWAMLVNDSLESGVQEFSLHRGESPGMIFLRFNAWLAEMFRLGKPELVVFEQPHHRGGAATHLHLGFVTRIEELCAKANVEYTMVHSATLKKWATGSGRAGKEEMVVRAREFLSREPIDDNEADAVLILYWAKESFVNEDLSI